MNKKATQVLLSISLASFISCAPSIKSSPERTKRSFYSRPVPLLLPYPWQPGKLKHERHELLKRNGLSLDFIDSLLNDPMFAEPGDDYQDDSFLHGNTFNEVTNHDDNSFLHGNTFNKVNNDENNMLAQVLAPEKDPMSNVIPEHQHATAAIQQSKSFQNCRISMAISSQEAVEASMMNTYFTDKRDTAGSLVPQLNMLNGDK